MSLHTFGFDIVVDEEKQQLTHKFILKWQVF